MHNSCFGTKILIESSVNILFQKINDLEKSVLAAYAQTVNHKVAVITRDAHKAVL